MKTISLDYDGTYTADPALWLEFVKMAKSRGHEVVVITMRTPEEALDIDPRLRAECTIMPTDRNAKRKHARTNGVSVDIWIDDVPEWIIEDARR